MNKDTTDFLSTLLWLAGDATADEGTDARALSEKSVYDFSPEFTEGAERFVSAGRAYLEAEGYTADVIDGGERSFGGNVYLSLSGHGAGFFDDRDEKVAALHDVIETWAGGSRFEDIDLTVHKGTIDLCVLPGYIKEYRDKLFAVSAIAKKEVAHV